MYSRPGDLELRRGDSATFQGSGVEASLPRRVDRQDGRQAVLPEKDREGDGVKHIFADMACSCIKSPAASRSHHHVSRFAARVTPV